MNSQQEYEQFWLKFSKTIRDIEDDFNHLSPENQQRISQEATAILRSYGHTITFEDLMREHFW